MFTCDPYYLVKKAKEVGYHSKVIAAGRTINDYMPKHVFGLLTDALNENEKPVKNSKIVVLGLSYKENVGDARESPSEELIVYLKDNKAHVTIVDPYINDKSYAFIEKDVYKALKDADAMVLMTGHKEFRSIDFERVKKLMKIPIVIDARRIYNPYDLKEMGFYYRGVGAIK